MPWLSCSLVSKGAHVLIKGNRKGQQFQAITLEGKFSVFLSLTILFL